LYKVDMSIVRKVIHALIHDEAVALCTLR